MNKYKYNISYLDKYTDREHGTTIVATSIERAIEKFYEWNSYKFYEIISITRGEEVK